MSPVIKKDGHYYTGCCTSVTMPEVINDIFRCQDNEECLVRVRFIYTDSNGQTKCKSGIITGILDNGDEIYIDAKA